MDIPNSVTNIEQYAFENCTSLTEFTFPNAITTISGSTVRGCTNLKKVTIPKSMSSIGNQTFYGCTSLNKIISYALIAPLAGTDCFKNVASNGVLYVPEGRSNLYSSWKNELNAYGWTVQEMTE